MTQSHLELVRRTFADTVSAHERFTSMGLPGVVQAADAISQSLASGGKVLAFGNGGSASDAQHFVGELVGRFEVERKPLPAVALTSDSNVVTAIANDYGYEQVFTRPIVALGRPGDVAFGISTSGKSVNVEMALAAAKRQGLLTIALTGRDGGRMGAEADIHLNVPETSTPRIQEVHRTILHAVCSLIDNLLHAG